MLKLTEELRRFLSEPQGILYEGKGVDPISKVLSDFEFTILACVGDVVSYYALKVARPDVIVLDGRSVRRSIGKDLLEEIEEKTMEYETLVAENPAGHITEDLVEKLHVAVSIVAEGRRVRVFVKGEEDLSVIPLALMLPKGSLIVYGQPMRGVVAVSVDENKRREMFEIVERMEKSGRTLEKLRRWCDGGSR